MLIRVGFYCYATANNTVGLWEVGGGVCVCMWGGRRCRIPSGPSFHLFAFLMQSLAKQKKPNETTQAFQTSSKQANKLTVNPHKHHGEPDPPTPPQPPPPPQAQAFRAEVCSTQPAFSSLQPCNGAIMSAVENEAIFEPLRSLFRWFRTPVQWCEINAEQFHTVRTTWRAH